ncbi:MAG: carboxypeptidase regulatory-like domain-containing protein, partial [Deltaproteobacteria bacterium]|nr:carboxypeptidase regulatory-like domain-containing protein [Deltaproteobacteria bacterium]
MRFLFYAVVVVSLTLHTTAIAQTFDAHSPPPPATSGDPLDPLLLWSGHGSDPGALTTALVLEYAREPLVRLVTDGDQVQRDPLLGNLVGLNLSAAARAHRRFGVAVSVPIFPYIDGVDGAAGPTPGDLRLWAPVQVVDTPAGGPSLAVIPTLTLPSGDSERYLGDADFGGGALAAFSARIRRFAVHTNAGVQLEPRTEVPEWPGGPRFEGGASVGWLVRDGLGVHVEGRMSMALARAEPPRVPTELFLTAKGRSDGPFWWSATVGRALTRGVGASSLRGYLTVGFAPWERQAWSPSGSPTRLKVVDTEGQPVRAATVVVAGRERGTTDHEGAFAFRRPPPSRLQVQVESLGFRTVDVQGVAAGDTTTLVLDRAPVPLTARVHGPDGAEVDAEVRLEGPVVDASLAMNDTGAFQHTLTPGDWRLVVSTPGMSAQERPIVVDATRTEEMAVEVVLTPEVEMGTDLVVQVTDPDGARVEGASVQVGGRPLGTTGTGGEITVRGFPRGSWDVEVSADAYAASAPTPVRVGKETSVVSVAVDWLPGSVKVKAFGPDGMVTDALVALSGPERLPAAALGADGERVFRLRPGRWNMLVSSPTLGAQERAFAVTDEPGVLVTVEVVLQPAEHGGADLAVTVLDPDGSPVEGAALHLDDAPLGRTSTLGTMTLQDLDAGPRLLQVEAPYFRSVQRVVDLNSGLQLVEEVLRWQPGTVQVTNTGPDLRPVDALVGFSGPSPVEAIRLGADGFERFTLDPGTWDLAISSASHGLQTRQLVVREEDADLVRVDVVMQPPEPGGGTLTVHVTDPEGAPLAGVAVSIDDRPLGSTSNAGKMSATELAPGQRTVALFAPAYQPVESVVRIRRQTEVTHQLAWSPGAVRVVVRDAEGPVDALIGVAGPRYLSSLRTDATGTRLLHLDPGTWWIMASSPTLGAQER